MQAIAWQDGLRPLRHDPQPALVRIGGRGGLRQMQEAARQPLSALSTGSTLAPT